MGRGRLFCMRPFEGMTATSEKTPDAKPKAKDKAEEDVVSFPVARIRAEASRIIGRSRSDTAGALAGLADDKELTPEQAQSRVDKWLTKVVS